MAPNASFIVRYILFDYNPYLEDNRKYKIAMHNGITETIVNHHLTNEKNKLPTPFWTGYIRELLILYQHPHDHTFFSVVHMATAESPRENRSQKNKKNINFDKKLSV